MADRERAALRPVDLVFRCIAWPERNASPRRVWRAVCIDLDLWATASSANEARGSLREAIGGYLETVLNTEDLDSIPRLIRRRPAPLRYRALWHVIALYRLIRPGARAFETAAPFHLGSATA
jgi:hypothetical protein